MTASEIGAQLSRARAANGLTIEELSQRTKIRKHVLELIERGEIGQLPSLVFARNFVRQYAANVALDPEPLLASMPQLDDSMRQLPAAPLHPRKRERAWRSSWQGNSNAYSGLMYAIPALLLGIGIGAWYHYRPALPQWHWPHVSAASAPQKAAGVDGTNDGSSVATLAREATQEPAVGESATGIPDHSADAATQSSEGTAQSSEGAAHPPEGAAAPTGPPIEVVVRAVEAAWVQLVVDGQTAFAGTMQANETRQLKAAGKVKIVAGKQGSLELSLNGKNLGPLEPSNEVRVVTLTAAGPEPRLPEPKPSGEGDRL